jgi:hypothetical protein
MPKPTRTRSRNPIAAARNKGQRGRAMRRAPNVTGGPLLPNPGSLVAAGAALLRGAGTARVPRSAAPIGPIEKISGEVARTISGYNPLRPKPAVKRAAPGQMGRKAGDTFKPGIKLDASRVKDWRKPRVDPKAVSAPREGASSSTSRGPSPRAIERANKNARFKRT